MPHTSRAPSSVEEVLATADLDSEWEEILEESPLPRGIEYDVEMLKDLSAATYPRMKRLLDVSRPADVVEQVVHINVPATDLNSKPSTNRAILVFPDNQTTQSIPRPWPVIVLFHGGGHTIGTPEQELLLARLLVQKFSALVVLPSYRLAPDHVFPSSFNDCFETLKQVAKDIVSLSEGSATTELLPSSFSKFLSLYAPLIIGGTSAGAGIAASLTHLYQRFRNTSAGSSLPSITGLLFSCGTILDPMHVPLAYKPYFFARKQNASRLPLDSDLLSIFYDACKPDRGSVIWASLDQYPELSREKVGEDHAFLKANDIRVYIQVCGADVSRDDGLIYERVLREEAGVETRLDLYSGFGHVFWGMSGGYSELSMSKKRMQDSVEGIGWLLRSELTRDSTSPSTTSETASK